MIDAYKGKERAIPRIKDQRGGKDHRNEELRFSSVVAVNQGKYDVALAAQDGHEVAVQHMVALKHQNYIVLRTGVEGQKPEELVVFPQSDASMLPHSGAAKQAMSILAALATFMAVIRA